MSKDKIYDSAWNSMYPPLEETIELKAGIHARKCAIEYIIQNLYFDVSKYRGRVQALRTVLRVLDKLYDISMESYYSSLSQPTHLTGSTVREYDPEEGADELQNHIISRYNETELFVDHIYSMIHAARGMVSALLRVTKVLDRMYNMVVDEYVVSIPIPPK